VIVTIVLFADEYHPLAGEIRYQAVDGGEGAEIKCGRCLDAGNILARSRHACRRRRVRHGTGKRCSEARDEDEQAHAGE
jgi:hypothetical protein